jgi:hypothetical protein
MAAHGTPPKGGPSERELLTELDARRRPLVAPGGERGARLKDESLHLRHVAAQRGGDLAVGQGSGFGHEQGGPLLEGKLAEVGQQLPHVLALLDLLDRRGSRPLLALRGSRRLPAPPEHRDAAVAGDTNSHGLRRVIRRSLPQS